MAYLGKMFLGRNRKLIAVLLLYGLLYIPLPMWGQAQDGHTSLVAGIASPTAASLGRYGDIPVSEFTGMPNITVPLFELQGRTLALPIELNYYSSGVRVEEIAGWAGLGWSLSAGGVITRTVRGLPDDGDDGYLGRGGDSTEVYLRSASVLPREYLRKIYQLDLDGEPDRYFFNVAGQSGEIFFARDESAEPYHYQPYTRQQQDVHVAYQLNNYGSIAAWILTTEDGTRYTFGRRESTVQSTDAGGMAYTSGWYLTNVKSARGDDIIDLTYQSDEGASVLQRNHVAFNGLPGDACSPQDYYRSFRSPTGSAVYLRKIETARHRAIFHRAGRSDGGGMRLASIQIQQRSGASSWTPLRRYELVHGYFNVGKSELHQRLRLDRVRQFDAASGELPFWSFAYNDSPKLPARDSHGQDYWGYYNGKSFNSGLAPKVTYDGRTYGSNDREPSEWYMLAGMLTEITYPTGGKTTFTWEGHRYGPSNTIGGGVRIQRIEHDTGMDAADNVAVEYQYGDGRLSVHPKMYHIHDYSRRTSRGTVRCHYLSRSSTSYLAPGMMNGSVIMYPEVTVLKGTGGGGGGKTVKRFTISLPTSLTDWPYAPAVLASWRGGQVRSSSELTPSGQMLKKQDHSFMDVKGEWIYGVVVGARFVSEYVPNQWEYIPNRYVINSGAFLPTGETQQVFDEEGTVTQSHTVSYDYDMLPERVQLTGKTETNSDGQQRITDYTYAHEQYPGMEAAHMLSQPYSVAVTNGEGTLLSKRWNLWDNSSGWWRLIEEIEWTGRGNASNPSQ